MTRVYRGVLAAALLTLLGLAAAAPNSGSAAARKGAKTPAAARDARTLTVFAAASLSDAFAEIGRTFERAHPGTRVRFNFAGTQQLVAQLEQGAAGDVFASADEEWMAKIVEGGRVEGEPRVFARNRLVVIFPRNNPGRISKLAELAKPGVKLVMCAAAVPAGRYARAAIARLASTPGFPLDFEQKVLANRVSDEENVRAVSGKIQLGEADVGIVYRSDVTRSVARGVHVLEIPDSSNVLASYPIAVLRKAPHAQEARAFVALVQSPEGQAILQRNGLMPAEGAAR